MAVSDLPSRSLELGDFSIREVIHEGSTLVSPHLHARAWTTIVVAGTLTDQADDSTEFLSAGDVLFRPPGRHENAIGASGSRCVVIDFAPSFLDPFCRIQGAMRSVRLRSDTLGGIPERISGELRSDDPLASMVIRGLVMEMIGTGLRITRSNAGPPPAWVVRARQMIESGFSSRLSIADAAAEAGVTPLALRHGLRRWYGKTFAELLRETRIAVALEMLESGVPLRDVAIQCGFHDQAHFTRAFRETRGISPQRYRMRFLRRKA